MRVRSRRRRRICHRYMNHYFFSRIKKDQGTNACAASAAQRLASAVQAARPGARPSVSREVSPFGRMFRCANVAGGLATSRSMPQPRRIGAAWRCASARRKGGAFVRLAAAIIRALAKYILRCVAAPPAAPFLTPVAAVREALWPLFRRRRVL